MVVDGRRFLIVGHRGAAAKAPENTAASLTAGLDAGAGAIEVDVGLTRDGRVVLLHDTTLDRTTNGRGPLRALPWPAVAALDAGSWFAGRFAGEPPIDLDDALSIVRAHVPLIVEVKPMTREREGRVDREDRALIDGVLAAFERTGGFRGVTMSSAAWSLLEDARAKAPALDVALTVRSLERRDPVAWAQRVGATALHPSRRLCTPSFVGRARGLGLAVIAYTVNTSGELRPLLEAGVDGVFTDDPAGIRRKLAARTREEKAEGGLTLGIDQGSGGTRAVLADAAGRVVESGEARLASTRTKDGAIVQDAEAVAASVVRAAGPLVVGRARTIGAAGLAVQRSSLVVWRRSDARPVTPVLSWRAGTPYEVPAALAASEERIAEATGLTVRFPYGAVRLAALRRDDPEVAEGLDAGRYVAGPLGAFLVARLTRGDAPACDPSLAQRTLAWDFRAGRWSDQLAAILGVPALSWPKVAPSTSHRGFLRLGRSRVPLHALAGDVGAAVRGAGQDDAGVLVLGTGGFVVVPTGRAAVRAAGLLTSILYEDAAGPLFAVEGTVHGLAAAIARAGASGGWQSLPVERIASRAGSATRAAAVTAAPEGTGTPDWVVAPRFSIDDGCEEPEAIVAGTLDDLARRFGAIAALVRDAGLSTARCVATGGAAASPHLTVRIARAMRAEIDVDHRPLRTAAGASLLARDAV
ncbi:MAG TPA: glycerophosphodiester phosphodiesterase family protein [Candidatus Polarisedimenticolaceae bacterium]|nr:glycerophosphodiester phosphodiesterase family protein [Candidatus Polarisedimenticolaceae bacterium]